ncbi:MAG: VOC family protein [Chitinophagales bacterium]
MKAVNPYLNFNGNTEEAFNFYKSVFGGEFSAFQKFKDMPGTEKLSVAEKEKIMHVALPIGKDNMLMASDVIESMRQNIQFGNNFQISLIADSEAEADKVFNGLSSGGKVTMPLAKAFWGAYFGMLTDKYGVQWMINYDYPK